MPSHQRLRRRSDSWTARVWPRHSRSNPGQSDQRRLSATREQFWKLNVDGKRPFRQPNRRHPPGRAANAAALEGSRAAPNGMLATRNASVVCNEPTLRHPKLLQTDGIIERPPGPSSRTRGAMLFPKVTRALRVLTIKQKFATSACRVPIEPALIATAPAAQELIAGLTNSRMRCRTNCLHIDAH